MRRVRERDRRDQRGVTLVELVVTMALLSVVGTLVVPALVSNERSVSQVDDETRGLADLRIVTERLSRDLRSARGVDPASDARSVRVWIDADSDYRQSPAETITWQLVAAGARPGQFDVVRADGTGLRTVVGGSVISGLGFAYDPPPPLTRLVSVAMTYDALPGRAARPRTTTFRVRLRNVQ